MVQINVNAAIMKIHAMKAGKDSHPWYVTVLGRKQMVTQAGIGGIFLC